MFDIQEKQTSFLSLCNLSSIMHNKKLIVAQPDLPSYCLIHPTETIAQLQKSFLAPNLFIIHCKIKINSVVRIFLNIIHLVQDMIARRVQQIIESPTKKQHFHGYVIIMELISCRGLKCLNGKLIDESWQLGLVGPQQICHDFDEKYLLAQQIFIERKILYDVDVFFKDNNIIAFADDFHYIFYISHLQKKTIDLNFRVQNDVFLSWHIVIDHVYVFHELNRFRKQSLSENSISSKRIQYQQCVIHISFRSKCSNFSIRILVNLLELWLQDGLNFMRMIRSKQIKLDLYQVIQDTQHSLPSCPLKKGESISDPIQNSQLIINLSEAGRQGIDTLVLNDQGKGISNMNSEYALKVDFGKIKPEGKLQEVKVIRSIAQIKQDNLSQQVHTVIVSYLRPFEDILEKLNNLQG